MAPTTRLRLRPERRVNYADTARRAGTRSNPIVVEETPGPRGNYRAASGQSLEPSKSSKETTARRESGVRKVSRVTAGAVVKPKAMTKKQAKKKSVKQECLVCVETKTKDRCFKAPEDACEHLQSICTVCITKMLRTKMTERQLTEAELSCPFDNCGYALNYAALRASVSKATFTIYDNAVTKHALSTGELYTACLSFKCGLHFSVEDCNNGKGRGKRGKQFLECPYCEHKTCLKCNQPWSTHGRGGCDKVKIAENKQSEDTVKMLGAKPCPKCGINIQKNGGCDHMTCENCRHHFCWMCLAPQLGKAPHREDCRYFRPNIAADRGNWVPAHVGDAQILALFHRAAGQGNAHAPPAHPRAARRPARRPGPTPPPRPDPLTPGDILEAAIIIAPRHRERVLGITVRPR